MKLKTCQKCQKEFPYRFKTEDGKEHVCNLRKFCLQCSPFNKHNTKDLTKEDYISVFSESNGVKYKICPKCSQKFEITKENFYITKKGKIYSHCKSCGKTRTLEQQRSLKLKAIKYKGGCCEMCGYNKYFGSLDFHHIDPSKKDFGISKGRCYNFEKIKIELDKCKLVCKNCHGEIHGGIKIGASRGNRTLI